MNPPMPITSSQIIMLLAAVMLVLQLLLVVQRMLITNIRLFAIQSLLLAGIAAVVGYAYDAWHVYVLALLTLLGKVLFLPWRLERLRRGNKNDQEIQPIVELTPSTANFG